MVQSTIFFLICYFFTKKAGHFIEDGKILRKRMKITMWIVQIAVIGATFVQIFTLEDLDKALGSLCKTFYFILPNTVN